MKKISKILVFLMVVTTMLSCNKKKDTKSEPVKVEKSDKKVTKKADAKAGALKEIDWKDDKGIGPIKEDLKLGDLDDALAEKGKKLFKEKCTACHKLKKRYIGPGLKGVTKRRRPEWVMNMILNPNEMVVKNAAAKKLIEEYNAPMADQSVGNDGARALLEYFRRVDSK